jgi:hypothetical protein
MQPFLWVICSQTGRDNHFPPEVSVLPPHFQVQWLHGTGGVHYNMTEVAFRRYGV